MEITSYLPLEVVFIDKLFIEKYNNSGILTFLSWTQFYYTYNFVILMHWPKYASPQPYIRPCAPFTTTCEERRYRHIGTNPRLLRCAPDNDIRPSKISLLRTVRVVSSSIAGGKDTVFFYICFLGKKSRRERSSYAFTQSRLLTLKLSVYITLVPDGLLWKCSEARLVYVVRYML